MAENNKVQLKREEVVGDEVVLSDIYPKTNTDSIEDYQGNSLSKVLDRIYNDINNKLSRHVNSVNGRTGVVVLAAEDVGLGNVTNVSFGDIKKWVIEQIQQAFKDRRVQIFSYLEEAIAFADSHDETNDGTPFFSEMGFKHNQALGYEDHRACIGYFYYENNALQVAYRMLNTIGSTDCSIIYNEKLEYNNQLYTDKDYRGGKIGVNIHKDEKALVVEEAQNKTDGGLRIDRDVLIPRLYFFDGVYGKSEGSLAPDDPEALLYYTTPPSERFDNNLTRRVDIYIDGVEINTQVSNPDNPENPILKIFLRKELKVGDLLITNFNDTGYYDTANGLYVGMLDSLTCRQFSIGKVTSAPDVKNVNRHFRIDFYQSKVNVCHGLTSFPTDGYENYYGPGGTSIGISQFAVNNTALLNWVTPGVLAANVIFNQQDLPNGISANMSGINTSSSQHREYRDGLPKRETGVYVITPSGQTNQYNTTSTNGDTAYIGTNYSLCVIPRVVYDNFKLLEVEPEDWSTKYDTYFKKTRRSIPGSAVEEYVYLPVTEYEPFVEYTFYECSNDGYSNAHIGKNIPINAPLRSKNNNTDENESLLGVNLEKSLITPTADALDTTYAGNMSGLRINNQDSLNKNALGISNYEVLMEEPDEWETTYTDYYRKKHTQLISGNYAPTADANGTEYGDVWYEQIEDAEAPTFTPGEFYKNTPWAYTKGKHTGGLSVNPGQGLQIEPGYVKVSLTDPPEDWADTYRDYYIKNANNVFVPNTYSDWDRVMNVIYRKADGSETGVSYYGAGKVGVKISDEGSLAINSDGDMYVSVGMSPYPANAFPQSANDYDESIDNVTNFGGLSYFDNKSYEGKYVSSGFHLNEDDGKAGLSIARGLGIRLSNYAYTSDADDNTITPVTYKSLSVQPHNFDARNYYKYESGEYVKGSMGEAWAPFKWHYKTISPMEIGNLKYAYPLTLSVSLADPKFGTMDWKNCTPPPEIYGGLRYFSTSVCDGYDQNKDGVYNASAIGIRVSDTDDMKGTSTHKGTRGLCIDEITNVLGIQISGWSEDGLSFDSNGKLIMTGFIRVDANLATLKANWDKCYILNVPTTDTNKYSIQASNFVRLWNSQSEAESATGVSSVVYKRVFDASHSF